MGSRKSFHKSSNPPYELWISPVDDAGVPLDPSFVSAAREIGKGFFRYRQRELGCASLTNDLVQKAVKVATMAKRERPVKNYAAYLSAVFVSIVDKFLAREARTARFEAADLENLAAYIRSKDKSAENIEERVEMREILDYLDEETRQIACLRLQGYSMKEIAAECGFTRTQLGHRWERAVDRALGGLFQNRKRDEGQSKG